MLTIARVVGVMIASINVHLIELQPEAGIEKFDLSF
jgi:hypothetical protein